MRDFWTTKIYGFNMQNEKLTFELFSRYRGSLMGIAILGVCVLHAFSWGGMGDSMIAKAMGPIARIAFTEGFLFLSGLGLYYSFSKNNNMCSFYTKRVHRVLIPYVLMTAPFFMYNFVVENSSLPKVLLQSSTLYFWFFGNDGMWYISMSMVLYLIFPFVYRFIFVDKTEKRVLERTLFLVAICILACYGLYRYVPSYYNMVTIGISKTPIFFIGMLVGFYSCKKKAMSLSQFFWGYIAVHNIFFEKSL